MTGVQVRPRRRTVLGTIGTIVVLLLVAGLMVGVLRWSASDLGRLFGAVALALLGLYLWFQDRKAPGSKVELGAAFLGGAVIAFAVLFLQEQRQAITDKQSLQLTLSLQKNLAGIDLRGRDLSGFYLGGKNLSHALLQDTNLREAIFQNANLDHANLSDADLRGADLRFARNLRTATFEDAKVDDQTKWPAWFDASPLEDP